MGKPTHRPAEPPPIDARLIELPVPVETPPVEEPAPAPSVQPEPPPAVVPKPKPPSPVRPRRAPVTRQKSEVITAGPGAGAGDTPSVEQAPAVNNSANSGPYEGSDSSRGNMYGNSSARAIVQPMPQIPDDLRALAFRSSALARFHIAVDGSAEVELAKPTPIPRLNRILLDTLKKWRFMPAIKNGQPVSSTEEILVKIEVK
ncbi:MAG: hypothetical protein WAN11_22025 [Syntrophobacteraceae bacterium]